MAFNLGKATPSARKAPTGGFKPVITFKGRTGPGAKSEVVEQAQRRYFCRVRREMVWGDFYGVGTTYPTKEEAKQVAADEILRRFEEAVTESKKYEGSELSEDKIKRHRDWYLAEASVYGDI